MDKLQRLCKTYLEANRFGNWSSPEKALAHMEICKYLRDTLPVENPKPLWYAIFHDESKEFTDRLDESVGFSPHYPMTKIEINRCARRLAIKFLELKDRLIAEERFCHYPKSGEIEGDV